MDLTQIPRLRGNFLWGSFYREGADGFVDTIDPSTSDRLGRTPWRLSHIDTAIQDARSVAVPWADSELEQRIGYLRATRALLEERQGAIATIMALEMGKPLWAATLECMAAVKAIDLLVEQGRSILAEQHHPTANGILRRRPMGVVAVVTPSPYPVFGPIQLIVPTLLAGNCVVWNPSSQIPISSQRVAEVFEGARLPPGVFSMVQGPRDPIGEALVAHQAVDMTVAAGSPQLGEALRDRCEEGRLWVQTGGKGWAFVCQDAHLDRAVYEVVTSAFLSAGQRCNATSRVVVESAVAEEFINRVVGLSKGLKIGSPLELDSFCGPLSERAGLTAFQKVLKRFQRKGSPLRLVVEGGTSPLPTALRKKGMAYVAPAIAVVDGRFPDGYPLPEEVEGPLLVVVVVDSVEEGLEGFADHPYGLAASVFTESDARFADLSRQLQAGAVNWNRGTIVASTRYPNAGLKRSGHGAEGNSGLMLATTWPQAVLSSSGIFDPSHRVPGMSWPKEMDAVDPSSMTTPPYNPEDDTIALPLEALDTLRHE